MKQLSNFGSLVVSVPADSTAHQVIIRPAKPKDLQGMAETIVYSFHPPEGPISWFYPVLKFLTSEDLRGRLNSDPAKYLCLVAILLDPEKGLEEAEVVGTAEISVRPGFPWPNPSYTFVYLANLAVKNSYRRRGIARQLLSYCEQTAREWGYNHLTLHVLENNHRAKQLYASSGYKCYEIEPSLNNLLFNFPRRLLLSKSI